VCICPNSDAYLCGCVGLADPASPGKRGVSVLHPRWIYSGKKSGVAKKVSKKLDRITHSSLRVCTTGQVEPAMILQIKVGYGN
jgi:hypothetical protein